EKTPGRHKTYPHLGGTGAQRRARAVEPTGAKGFYRGLCNRAFQRWQRPRFVHQFGQLDPASPSQWIFHACQDDKCVVVEGFEAELLFFKGAATPGDDEVKAPRVQFTMQEVRPGGHDMKNNAGVTPREPIDDGGDKAVSARQCVSDPHLSDCRIGKKLDMLHTLAQIVEYGHST